MLDVGINVALGTDSCASSPNLNLVDDLRLVREVAPEVDVEKLWEMVTLRAARAVGAEKNVGSLSVGKFADFVVFPIRLGAAAGRNPGVGYSTDGRLDWRRT